MLGMQRRNLQHCGSGELQQVLGRDLQLHQRFLLHELHRGDLRGHGRGSDLHCVQLWALAGSGGPDRLRKVRDGPKPERHGAE